MDGHRSPIIDSIYCDNIVYNSLKQINYLFIHDRLIIMDLLHVQHIHITWTRECVAISEKDIRSMTREGNEETHILCRLNGILDVKLCIYK